MEMAEAMDAFSTELLPHQKAGSYVPQYPRPELISLPVYFTFDYVINIISYLQYLHPFPCSHIFAYEPILGVEDPLVVFSLHCLP